MKNKFIMMILVIAMLFGTIGGLIAEDTASITINTYVQESTANSGIRTTETLNQPISGLEFDNLFFNSTSNIVLGEGVDVSTENQTGSFSVMVRRVELTGLKVTATGSKMKLVGGNDNQTIDYFIKERTDAHNWVKMNPSSLDYDIEAPTIGIIRNFTTIDYKIPTTTDASSGSYKATITFTVTTQ